MSRVKRACLAVPVLLVLPVILIMYVHGPKPAGANTVPAGEAVVSSAAVSAVATDSVHVLEIDLERSFVQWRGTKLVGSPHEGIVKFQEGELLVSGSTITGGRFVVDMTSIEVTDIPKSDPVPRRNLTTHLNSDFATRIFPTAAFTFTEVRETGSDTWQITGDLSIRGVTRPITVTATRDRNGNLFTTDFTFDRFDWGIGEDGTWLERRLVDAEVQVGVRLLVVSCEGTHG